MTGTPRVIAGIGCRPGCSADAIAALVRRAEDASGRHADLLAVPDFRADAAGPRGAATMLGLPLLFASRAALLDAQPGCPTRSAAALRATGLASVAEGCALAAAGPGGRLILARVTGDGVTCALAETAPGIPAGTAPGIPPETDPATLTETAA